MKTRNWRLWLLGCIFFLLFGGSSLQAQDVNLEEFLIPVPLKRWCSYTFVNPQSFPGFTLKFTPTRSGPYTGKYRYGDWNYPDPGKTKFMIVDWGKTNFYIYADNNGDFPTPVAMPLTYPLDTMVVNPFESGNYWYMRILTNVATPRGILPRVLLWIVLDGAFSPNSVNTSFGLNPATVPYGVTGYTYYAPGLGELRDVNVDAGTGAITIEYVLKTRESRFRPQCTSCCCWINGPGSGDIHLHPNETFMFPG